MESKPNTIRESVSRNTFPMSERGDASITSFPTIFSFAYCRRHRRLLSEGATPESATDLDQIQKIWVPKPPISSIHVKIKRLPGRTNDLILTTTFRLDETFDELLYHMKSSLLNSYRYAIPKQHLDRYTHFKDSTGCSEYLGKMCVQDVWQKDMMIVMEFDLVPESDSEEEKIVWIGANEHPPSLVVTPEVPEILSLERTKVEQAPLSSQTLEKVVLAPPFLGREVSLRLPQTLITYLDLTTYNSLRAKEQFAEYKIAKNTLLNYYQVLLGKELPLFRVTSQGRDATLKYYAEVDVTDLV